MALVAGAMLALACSDDVDRTSAAGGAGGTGATGSGTSTGTTTGTGTGGTGGVDSGLSFAERCAGPEVLACWGFDTAAETEQYLGDSGFSPPEFDDVVFAEGGGSIHMRVLEGSDPYTSGDARLSFPPGVGVGETLYMQWRQRFSASFIQTEYDANGWKQLIINENGQSGCSDSEIVVTNAGEARDYPIVYHACNIFHSPVENPVDGNQWEHDLQPGGDNHCFYTWIEDGLDFLEPSDDVDGLACIGYDPDMWMTFQLAVHIGSWCYGIEYEQCPEDSRFELWVTKEGSPPVHVIDWPVALRVTSDPSSTVYDSVTLTPYNTNKNPAQSHPPAELWYDSVIVSKARIAEP